MGAPLSRFVASPRKVGIAEYTTPPHNENYHAKGDQEKTPPPLDAPSRGRYRHHRSGRQSARAVADGFRARGGGTRGGRGFARSLAHPYDAEGVRRLRGRHFGTTQIGAGDDRASQPQGPMGDRRAKRLTASLADAVGTRAADRGA